MPLLFLFMVSAFCGRSTDIIPPELVGVWAPATAKVQYGLVWDGYAICLNTNGVASLIEAPPPIGEPFHADYNTTNHVLTLRMAANPSEGLWKGETNCLIYDPKEKTLSFTKGIIYIITLTVKKIESPPCFKF